MAVPCSVCASQHRRWIEQLRCEGIPANVIGRRLHQTYGERISGDSLRRHFRAHFDISGALRDKYAASDALRDAAAGKLLSDVQRLDAVISDSAQRSAELGQRIDEMVAANDTPPMAIVEAYKAATSEMRQAIKQKADLLGDQPTDSVDRLLQALWGADGHVRGGIGIEQGTDDTAAEPSADSPTN